VSLTLPGRILPADRSAGSGAIVVRLLALESPTTKSSPRSKAHHLTHPERSEYLQGEGERPLDVGHLNPEMIEHDRESTRRAAPIDDPAR